MIAVHILGDGRAFDDGQHAVAHAEKHHKHDQHIKLRAAHPGRNQQGRQTQWNQARNQPVGPVQVKVMFKEIQQQAPQHLDGANAGGNGNGPGFTEAVLTQQAYHVRR